MVLWGVWQLPVVLLLAPMLHMYMAACVRLPQVLCLYMYPSCTVFHPDYSRAEARRLAVVCIWHSCGAGGRWEGSG
jgi:hypothetical protein